VGKKTLGDGAVDVRARGAAEDNRVAVRDVVKWVMDA
jgi:glycyl-tRNA synthetase (class II)